MRRWRSTATAAATTPRSAQHGDGGGDHATVGIVRHAKFAAEQFGDQGRLGQRGEFQQQHAVGEIIARFSGDAQGDAGFADAAGADNGHQRALGEAGGDVGAFAVAADKGRRLERQIMALRRRLLRRRRGGGDVVDHVGDEAVAAAGDGLDEAFAVRVAERAADLGDLGGEVVFGDGLGGPDLGHDGGFGGELARMAQQREQHVSRAAAEIDRHAVSRQFAAARMEGEFAEAEPERVGQRGHHGQIKRV
jgi:hypothetical protein